MFYIRIFLSTVLTIACLMAASAQVKFKLDLLPDQETYLVSMIAEQTWDWPMNAVGAAQVVLQVPAGSFTVGQVHSLVPGISWAADAHVDNLPSAAEFTFICFVLNERGTKGLSFEAGQETPLFTFANTHADCAGPVQLADNESAVVKRVVRRERFNITQNMTVLGARGNAYSGVVGDAVDCTLLTTAKSETPVVAELKAFPNPTDGQLTVAWENLPGQEVVWAVFSDLSGKHQLQQPVLPASQGAQSLALDLSHWPSGLYTAYLATKAGERQFFHFIITTR